MDLYLNDKIVARNILGFCVGPKQSGRYAYIEKSGGGVAIIVSGVDERHEYPRIDMDNIRFIPKSNELAFFAESGNGERVQAVIGGIRGPEFQKCLDSPIAFSDDGKHHAYGMLDKDGSVVLIVDGKVIGHYETLLVPPVTSPTGAHFAAVVQDDGETVIVTDAGKSHAYTGYVAGSSITFSGEEQFTVVMDHGGQIVRAEGLFDAEALGSQ